MVLPFARTGESSRSLQDMNDGKPLQRGPLYSLSASLVVWLAVGEEARIREMNLHAHTL